jgi:iron complex transport system ATP-binding protein
MSVGSQPAPVTVMPALRLRGIGLTREGRALLDGVDIDVAPDERWVVLGRNGSGKSTLVQIMALNLHPSRGTVDVLGERLGVADVRALRRRVGYAAAALADQLRPGLTAREVVMTARYAALEPWWHTYTDDDRAQAGDRLARLGVGQLAERTFGTLSSGERQRVLVARTLMGEVGVVLLDEPTAGLDLGGREEFVQGLEQLAHDATSPPLVLVTHHAEEIPRTTTHCLLLADGHVLASGAIDDVLTAESLSATFGLRLDLRRRAGRWSATAVF